MNEAGSKIDQLAARLGCEWPHLRRARQVSIETREMLKQKLAPFYSEDLSIVVSGSLARNEFTLGSDIDWTLLVDGSADPKHHDLVREIGGVVDSVAGKSTGTEGTSGSLVFSHDLIHQIGGEDDTNRNTTRRLLLLLESCALGRDEAYRRVVRNVLHRYLFEDRGLWKDRGPRVPRFLLNDFARYWRTMAVDFAYKRRKRDGRGWAIRNVKLRMSRKLVYVSGLLACYRFQRDFGREEQGVLFRDETRRPDLALQFESVFRETPLEIVADVLLAEARLDGAARQIFDSYNEFVGMLDDPGTRDQLESLTEDEADNDALFQRAREVSHSFRDGLLTLFFDTDRKLTAFTRQYGVF